MRSQISFIYRKEEIKVSNRMKTRMSFKVLVVLVLALCLASASMASYRPDVVARKGVVSSAHSLSSYAGMLILERGGNAIDAAVAVASSLNVVEPNLSGAGGNGMMMIYDAATGSVNGLAMSGAAPMGLDPKKLSAEVMKSTYESGYTAGVVPGNFGGWIAALQKYGTMSLEEVLQPALEMAENGFPVSPGLSSGIANAKEEFKLYPTTANVFLPDGEAPQPDELLVMKDLAKTFRKVIAAEQAALARGASRTEALQAAFDRFYKGDIADEFARFYQANGGFFTKQDFANYKPIWHTPVHTTYKGYDVYSPAENTRGGIEVIMQLNLIEAYDLKKLGHNSAEALHLIAECIKITKADVYEYVADPAFTNVPWAGLSSKEYAAERRKLIDLAKAIDYPVPGDPFKFQKGEAEPMTVTAQGPVGPEPDGEECTTSFYVVDKFGNAVGCTPTLGSGWGTAVIVGNTGLFFNDGTRSGSTSPYPDDVNYVGPGKKGLLNNSPCMALKDGKLFMIWGSPGGEGIGQTQFQVFLNVVEFGMRIQDAIEAARFQLTASPDFYSRGAKISIRPENRVATAQIDKLKALGWTVSTYGEFSSSVGGMQGVLINQQFGTMAAGADPRRGGYAVGF